MSEYIVREVIDNKLLKETKFDYLQQAAEYYFKERTPFEYGRNGGYITLVKEEVLMSCN